MLAFPVARVKVISVHVSQLQPRLWAWKILGNCAILADGHARVTAVPVKEGVEIWQQSQVGWGHKYNCPFGLFGDRVFWYLLIFVHGNM